MLFFGWLLLFACGIEIAQAVMVGHWAGFFHHSLSAILFGVTGLILVSRPLLGAEVVTIFMAMFFLIGGLFQLIGSALGCVAGLGLAGVGRPHHVCAGFTCSGAMAGLGAMGDRAFYWH
jgi:uncharacterized membrane protein HdeD (DUF308 family)